MLVKLKKRYQDSRRCDYGIVECMAKDVLLLCGLIAKVHPAGLEFVKSAG